MRQAMLVKSHVVEIGELPQLPPVTLDLSRLSYSYVILCRPLAKLWSILANPLSVFSEVWTCEPTQLSCVPGRFAWGNPFWKKLEMELSADDGIAFNCPL